MTDSMNRMYRLCVPPTTSMHVVSEKRSYAMSYETLYPRVFSGSNDLELWRMSLGERRRPRPSGSAQRSVGT